MLFSARRQSSSSAAARLRGHPQLQRDKHSKTSARLARPPKSISATSAATTQCPTLRTARHMPPARLAELGLSIRTAASTSRHSLEQNSRSELTLPPRPHLPSIPTVRLFACSKADHSKPCARLLNIRNVCCAGKAWPRSLLCPLPLCS